MPVGIAVYDPEDRLIIKNNRFQLYDQTGERDRPGTPFVDIMKFGIELGLYPDALDGPENWIEARMHQRRSPGDVSIQQISDGRFIQIEDRRLEDGRLVSAYTDVTQLKHTEAALSVALRRSEEASESKTAFLAKMSHELRTPLNAIIGFSQMMMADSGVKASVEKRDGYLADIQFAATHLHELISEVLELARIDAGQKAFDPKSTDIATLCRQIERMFAHEVEKAEISLVSKVSSAVVDRPEHRLLDERLVTQMLINLLSNSMRFTPTGGTIQLEAVLDAECTRFLVIDTGTGISAGDLPTIHEPFQQGGRSPVRGGAGLGLGLSITKRLAELHGGSIHIESIEDVGTTVTLSFPNQGSLE